MRIISLEYILYFAIISSKSLLLEGNSIYQYVYGSLNERVTFSLKIFLETIEGVLLYCFDSERNQFGVRINNKDICINYNNVSLCDTLRNTCACDSCEGRWMEVEVEVNKGTIDMTCNGQGLKTLSLEEGKGKKDSMNPVKELPYPKRMNVTQRRLFVMIGNIDPYTSENNVSFLPMKKQIIACLNRFTHNKKVIPLIGSGEKVRGSCPKLCYNDTCNGGLCKKETVEDIFCDCSITALNGVYCNKSMKEYVQGKNNSYEKIKDTSEIYFKLTWKMKSYKNYCIVDFKGRMKDFTVRINKKDLMMDDRVITTVSVEEVYFMNGTITKDGMIIEINNTKTKMNVSSTEDVQINVGFSDNNGSCDTFEGFYDFHYDGKQMQQIYPTKEQKSATKTSNASNNKNMKIVGSIFSLSTVILCTTIFIMCFCNRRKYSTKENECELRVVNNVIYGNSLNEDEDEFGYGVV